MLLWSGVALAPILSGKKEKKKKIVSSPTMFKSFLYRYGLSALLCVIHAWNCKFVYIPCPHMDTCHLIFSFLFHAAISLSTSMLDTFNFYMNE